MIQTTCHDMEEGHLQLSLGLATQLVALFATDSQRKDTNLCLSMTVAKRDLTSSAKHMEMRQHSSSTSGDQQLGRNMRNSVRKSKILLQDLKLKLQTRFRFS